MARPRLILLIRHGESEGNCDKSVNRHTPNHKVPLTQKGREQAFNAGIELSRLLEKQDRVLFYTSPYLRARQTLDGILEGLGDYNDHNYAVYEEPRMREQDFGNFQGGPEKMQRIWKERAHYGHFFYRIPNGESAADVYDRCAGFNETLFRQFQNHKFADVLVLVTHGIWARVFLMKWFRWSVEEFEGLRNIPHCQFIQMVKGENQRYTLTTPLLRWREGDEDRVEEIRKAVRFRSGDLGKEALDYIVAAEREAAAGRSEGPITYDDGDDH
ncbi:hypothetical protein LJB42_003980 [Komagataella kurtzmanii]|nr:hypothetical protein LJB42_003980 [Komagataella kurtzmanii]